MALLPEDIQVEDALNAVLVDFAEMADSVKVVSEDNQVLVELVSPKIGSDYDRVNQSLGSLAVSVSGCVIADNLLVLFPGIHWEDKRKHVLKVDLKIARFYAKKIFHLFGFRSKQVDETHLKLYNRARNARTKLYEKESWFKSRY